MTRRLLTAIGIASICLPGAFAQPGDAPSAEEAAAALRKAVDFYRNEVSTEGGYLWRYSADLVRREGEGKADTSTIWVQPPGTPSIGFAYLDAYRLTGDAHYLEMARDAAHALVKGQLESGGWEYRIHFDPKKRPGYAYRVPPNGRTRFNTSTLDDDTTQAALRLLMRVDQALDFKDEAIHEAAMYALEKLLEAQYPNGAWPQRFTGPPDPAAYPVKPASYPETWSRVYEGKNYAGYYTFNDNTISDVIETMFEATEVYGDEQYRAAAEKAGGFILLAQMPDPQPAWAQQYDADMHPAWARKFEPPSVTGGESQGVMRTLIYLYHQTGDNRYLESVERALAYLKASMLPNGQLARFYELKTNTPLYFTREHYELTYSDADMPTHYGFKTGTSLDMIEQALESAKKSGPVKPGTRIDKPSRTTPELAAQSKAVIEALDDRGAWVERGRLKYHGDDDPTTSVIDSATFIQNVRTLSQYIAACK